MTTLIIGGGVVGLSVAYGLLKQGQNVTVLDGADDDFRASRGNFGLIWVQGKGINAPRYSLWSRQSAELWGDFAKDLFTETGVNVAHSNEGGIEYFTDENQLEQYVSGLTSLRKNMECDYAFEVLEPDELKKRVPQIGPKVIGGVFTTMDGHTNPLYLLRALTIAVRKAGGTIKTAAKVVDILAEDHDFTVLCSDGTSSTGDSIVLAAGLGARDLGHKLGFDAPIRPQQGQILITEKLPFFLRYPSGTLRQVNEGGIQIGASKAEVGLDDAEDITTLAQLAKHAIDIFPHLGKAKIVRSWAALRIMSPDGLPIYQRSEKVSGATFITCHSGITLSAAHARLIPRWILRHNDAPDVSEFSEKRFHV